MLVFIISLLLDFPEFLQKHRSKSSDDMVS